MNTDLPRVLAKLSVCGTKIVVTGYSDDLVEFYRSLPGARFHRADRAWSFDAMPSVAWRIAELDGVHAVVTLDTAVGSLMMEFRNSVRCRMESERDSGPQPDIRKTDGWRHQLTAYRIAQGQPATMLALGMGTGKSKVAVDLAINWDAQRVLIICPTTVMDVWRREFARHAGGPHNLLVLNKGSGKKQAELAKGFISGKMNWEAVPAIVVNNYESAWRPDFAKLALGIEWDLVILDESHRVKSHGSKVGKFVARLGRQAKRRLCLTGTPLPQTPLDIYGQYRFLDPGIFGTSWTAFRGRYAVMGNPSIPQQITALKNQEELASKMDLIAYRVGKEVLDLPPMTINERIVELSPKAAKIYRDLERDLIAEVEGGVITADNILVKLLRLQQITSGFLVHDETKKVVLIDKAKEEALRDILADVDEPVVVFAKFTHDLDRIRAVAEKLGRKYGEVSGKQKDLTDTATMPEWVDVLGVQIQSGGVGIDLTRAAIAVYYSLGYSRSDLEQSMARVHRPGQERPVSYYRLIIENTVDRSVYRALESRGKIIDAVLSRLGTGVH